MGKASIPQPPTGRERAARHRARLKARGLVRTQVLLPDLTTPDIQARLEAACRKLKARSNAELKALFALSDAAWSDTPD
jgi:hypothetical protein